MTAIKGVTVTVLSEYCPSRQLSLVTFTPVLVQMMKLNEMGKCFGIFWFYFFYYRHNLDL